MDQEDRETKALPDELELLRRKVAELEKKCEQSEEALRQSEDRFFQLFHASSGESEKKYRALVENSIQGLAIMQDSRIVFCNDALARISGYTVEELLSFPLGGMSVLLHPEDRTVIMERYSDRVAGKPVPQHYECRGIKKDGTGTWLEVYASVIEYNGKPAIQTAFMDITERKKAAENLLRTLEWQNAIFEGSRDAIMISDSNMKLVAANNAACKLTGYSKEELLEMHASDLQEAPDHQKLAGLRNQIMSGEDILGETKIFTKDGREIDVEFGHLRVIISGIPYIHTIARDVSERKRLEVQFLQAQKMEAIGVLAGGIAHDFNNLLNVINGYSELLLEDLPQDNSMHKDLEQIWKAGQQAASLTSQLLVFGRKQARDPMPLDLNAIITDMSKMLRRLIGEDIELVAITRPGLGLVNADLGQIQQIVMNLAVNARDAMHRGGKLTIETANIDIDDEYVREHPAVKAGSYVMLAISDNGIGMNEETRARLFEPFFTTKEKGKGTGLGLSTVFGIVKQSGGFVWVYSEPGKGTTFKTYLPRIENEIAKLKSETKPEQRFRGCETVLIVEDETPVRALASMILRERGYHVIEAADGNEALRLAQEFAGEIHLVLADVVMPGMNGKVMISQLEALRAGIKALYISGYADNAIVRHGELDPDVAFLQKPFTVEGLARKVREVINS